MLDVLIIAGMVYGMLAIIMLSICSMGFVQDVQFLEEKTYYKNDAQDLVANYLWHGFMIIFWPISAIVLGYIYVYGPVSRVLRTAFHREN